MKSLLREGLQTNNKNLLTEAAFSIKTYVQNLLGQTKPTQSLDTQCKLIEALGISAKNLLAARRVVGKELDEIVKFVIPFTSKDAVKPLIDQLLASQDKGLSISRIARFLGLHKKITVSDKIQYEGSKEKLLRIGKLIDLDEVRFQILCLDLLSKLGPIAKDALPLVTSIEKSSELDIVKRAANKARTSLQMVA